MKDLDAQPEGDVLEGDGAVGREHVRALPALRSVELGAARRWQRNPGCG